MRLQIVELPSEVVGDIVQTPFLLILDEVSQGIFNDPELPAVLTDETGARATLLFKERVEVVRE